jgi:hypothetical protein
MRVHRNPTVKVDANQNLTAVDVNQNPTAVDVDQNLTTVDVDQNPVAVDTDQSLITSVAETTGRVAAKVTNVLGSLTGALKSRRNKQG